MVTVDAGPAGTGRIDVSMEVPHVREVVLVAEGDTWRYFKGITAPPAKWNTLDCGDTSWLEGRSGIGYGKDRSYPTDLKDMQGKYVTVYMRRSFDITDINSVVGLKLGIRYDDGFVAYLNGREIARSHSLGSPATPIGFKTPALSQHHYDNGEEIHCLEMGPGLLAVGKNVLAVEFHNTWAGSADACAVPGLTALVIPAKAP
jgi:hypothetical protein